MSELGGGDVLRVERPVYGGSGLARRAGGEVVLLPFVLPGEQVTAAGAVLEPSPDRRSPHCVHFGRCGGCHYQMASYEAQLAMKRAILVETLAREGVPDAMAGPLPPVVTVASPEEWGYRNRIRLRLQAAGSSVEVGYSTRGEAEFLPIRMCPIAAPWLWQVATAFQRAVEGSEREVRALLDRLLERGAELELFSDGAGSWISLTLLVDRTSGKAKSPSVGERVFSAFTESIRVQCPALRSAGVLEVYARSGRPASLLAAWGGSGTPYPVGDEKHWVSRGGFFQVNRLLVERLVGLVTVTRAGEPRSGALAWDLYAGVGLFSLVLAKRFAAVTAVEANPAACADLRRQFDSGKPHRAVESTTVEFLRGAVIQRERPELLVLDPPRAGAGEEVCRLLARLAPTEIVYVSCDPTTLARDLLVLTESGYVIEEIRLVDLFPQTFHLETVAVLRRPAQGATA